MWLAAGHASPEVPFVESFIHSFVHDAFGVLLKGKLKVSFPCMTLPNMSQKSTNLNIIIIIIIVILTAIIVRIVMTISIDINTIVVVTGIHIYYNHFELI